LGKGYTDKVDLGIMYNESIIHLSDSESMGSETFITYRSATKLEIRYQIEVKEQVTEQRFTLIDLYWRTTSNLHEDREFNREEILSLRKKFMINMEIWR
jgi:hypothetical protein